MESIDSKKDQGEVMKQLIKAIVLSSIFLIFLVSIITGGCLTQNSSLSGENGTENKGEIANNESSPTSYLKTEAVNISELGAGNSILAGNSTPAGNFTLARNYKLQALNVELKAPSMSYL